MKFVRYKAQKKEPVFKKESIEVKYESYGLAGELHTRCSRRTGRMRGHTTICHADTIQAQNHNKPDNKICAINLRAIIATQLIGCSHTDLEKIAVMLGLNSMSFKSYKKIENYVGEKSLEVISNEVKEKALADEIEQTEESYTTEKYGNLPALAVTLDMGWNKRSSGRRYDSPSGVLHAIGAKTGKIIYSAVYKNKCNICDKIEGVLDAMEKGKTSNEEKLQMEQEVDSLKRHNCQKNFHGSSKSMESDAIVSLVSKAPSILRAYVRFIVMDDDTTTPQNLQEDLGPRSSGRLEKCLTGISFLADPSHRRRTYSKHCFQLVGGVRARGWMLRNDQAKKLTTNFGYFQAQLKGLTLEDAKLRRYEPLHHISGNHLRCGDWCRGKRPLKWACNTNVLCST